MFDIVLRTQNALLSSPGRAWAGMRSDAGLLNRQVSDDAVFDMIRRKPLPLQNA